MSVHPWEAVTGAVVIPALVFVIPIHVGALAAVLTIMTIMGIGNHMGWEMFPRALVHGPIGKWLITASHHERHHQLYACNYGLYFRYWDKLCGTDSGIASFAHAPEKAPAKTSPHPSSDPSSDSRETAA
jgi:sterol desaturase/sphingolipid hydroxylase (fatty acid hydroxylase superfamily)